MNFVWIPYCEEDLDQQLPAALAPGTGFVEDNFPMLLGMGGGLEVIQGYYIYCSLYFYYYISSTSDYQALDPGG